MENVIFIIFANYPIAVVLGIIAIKLLYTLYKYHCAVNDWFDEYVYNTLNNTLGKPKHKPSILRIVFGTETAEFLRKHFNNNGREESNKYEYLKNTIEDSNYHYVFNDLCEKYNIKNTRLFKNFIYGKAKQRMSIKRKHNEYLKVIKHVQEKYEKEMWNGWKLKDEFEYD